MVVPSNRSRVVAGSRDYVEAAMDTIFKRSTFRALHGIEFEHADGVLAMVGSVPSCYLKQIAFALLSESLSEIPIDDRIEVTSF